MGTRRGMTRRRYRAPLWGADTHPIHDGPDLALEWGGGNFHLPRPPRFPRRVALVLLLALLFVSVFLPIGCALTRAEPAPTQEPPRPAFQR